MELTYPKDYHTNLAWRRNLLLKAQHDLVFREKVRELFFRDILFAFNAFFFTLDVRRRPEHHQPFCTYPFQDETILAIVKAVHEGHDLPIEKSRDMGASWMVILVFLWYWLNPKGGVDFLLGSRIEDYVDKKGDMRTLFQKARYAFYKLPKWLWPKQFNSKVHDNFMKLQNPESGSAITGESNNANFSTGGRYAAVLFDEFAKWEGTDKAAWTSAGDATPSRIPVSTPFGAAGQYYDLVTDPTKEKIRLHWSLHPLKAEGAYCNYPLTKEDLEGIEGGCPESFIRSPWYDMQSQRRSPAEIAQELDIDYIGAGNPVFDGKTGKRIGVLLKTKREPKEYKEINLGGLNLISLGSVGIREAEGLLIVFVLPNPEHSYVFGVDVVEGTVDGDFASIKVLNRVTKDVDASYYSRINEVELARVIKTISDYYKTFEAPWVGIETNAAGLSTFDFCYETFDVSNLFMMPVFDSAKQGVSYKKGWRTTSSSRNILISGIKDWLLDKRGWCDSRLCREFTTFIHNTNGKAEAKTGAHDDEVMAFGIAIQVDLIAPMNYFEAKEVRDENLFSIKHFPAKKLEGEPITIEERCLACALKNIEEKRELNMFGSINSLNESVEYGWDNY